ncbi:glyoxylase-like metal-dependent hydrolase (beta-lactamase superfamily II) [Litoreibacter ponti]|uniref:Glyoxylase-like metal-dependent hydrolase (Beta-lactamase superfamily II) n=1 Tax=Litoreibacter ponti TaxID=1510457 RepID=A0A2T6BEL4_9RHOB|nr:MBL fold metallo-hydrolase [Litoreibacter ponti]PTX54474.1 glyoxylase-like metal-dependent hydrolase (beta-lactamase superfamily II) [Litoreibacter ponti]
MSLTRRRFVQGTAALPLAAAIPSFSKAELSLGSATLTTVSDGSLVLPGSFIFEPMPKDELAPILTEFDLSEERLTPECNLALFRDGTNTVLFDVGSGPDFMPSAGTIVDSLEALDLAPEDITHVIFTHAHPDHIWGLLDEFDDPLFVEARYMMGRGEWDYWWNPETVNTIGDARAAFAVGAKRRMEAIEDAVELFDAGDEVLPGIAAVSTPGHTPGHMAFEVRQGSEAVLIAGDAIGNHHVAFRKPGWESGADQDAPKAAETRKMLFDRLVSEDMALIGFHLPQGGIGRVDTNGDGYRFVEQG